MNEVERTECRRIDPPTLTHHLVSDVRTRVEEVAPAADLESLSAHDLIKGKGVEFREDICSVVCPFADRHQLVALAEGVSRSIAKVEGLLVLVDSRTRREGVDPSVFGTLFHPYVESRLIAERTFFPHLDGFVIFEHFHRSHIVGLYVFGGQTILATHEVQALDVEFVDALALIADLAVLADLHPRDALDGILQGVVTQFDELSHRIADRIATLAYRRGTYDDLLELFLTRGEGEGASSEISGNLCQSYLLVSQVRETQSHLLGQKSFGYGDRKTSLFVRKPTTDDFLRRRIGQGNRHRRDGIIVALRYHTTGDDRLPQGTEAHKHQNKKD